MNAFPGTLARPRFPDSDGKPMADNTVQARWIFMLYGNLSALFAGRPDVFVAADLLWYPDPTDDTVRAAPDALVVFGRPKGDRGSYKQWEEDNVPVTVAFEVYSPGNDAFEMGDKQQFYEEHGVEEYYFIDPERDRLHVFLRSGGALRRVRPLDLEKFASPRLGIRFRRPDGPGGGLTVYGPDGRRFITFEELMAERSREENLRIKAEQRAGRLADLMRKVLAQQATPGEREELERLLQVKTP